MTIYWIVWFLLCLSALVSKHKHYINKFFYILTLFFLIYFVGFRYEIGGDWGNYLEIYENHKYSTLDEIFSGNDIGYHVLNLLGHQFGFKDTIFVNLICSVIVFFCLGVAFLKLKYYWLSLLFYYPYHILVLSMGYTRQSVAVAAIFLAIIYLLENKRVKSFILLIVAFLFHKTAIVFLLIYFLTFIGSQNLKKIYIFLSPIFLTALIYLESISADNIYLGGMEEMDSQGIFMRLTIHIIPILIYLYFRFYKRNVVYSKENILILDYSLVLIFLLTILSFVFSTFADRFNLYFIYFDIVVVCTYLRLLSVNYFRFFLVLIILYWTLFLFFWLNYSFWAKTAWIPYQNYISNYLFNSVF